MKAQNSRTIYGVLAVLLLSLTMIGSCKKNSNTDDPAPAAKTLNKAFLYDKSWYNKGATVKHIFYSNGKYGSATGATWVWLNNSDSMYVDNVGNQYTLHFAWSTEHECSISIQGGAYSLYKDEKW